MAITRILRSTRTSELEFRPSRQAERNGAGEPGVSFRCVLPSLELNMMYTHTLARTLTLAPITGEATFTRSTTSTEQTCPQPTACRRR